MNEKEQLQAKIYKLRKRLSTIDHNEAQQANEKLLGKCFKYRNNYSCPKKPSDYWWLYVRVGKVDGNVLSGLEFQVDKYGEITINPKKGRMHTIDSNFVPISKRTFNSALKKLQKKVMALS